MWVHLSHFQKRWLEEVCKMKSGVHAKKKSAKDGDFKNKPPKKTTYCTKEQEGY